jgi:hypothetical protein
MTSIAALSLVFTLVGSAPGPSLVGSGAVSGPARIRRALTSLPSAAGAARCNGCRRDRDGHVRYLGRSDTGTVGPLGRDSWPRLDFAARSRSAIDEARRFFVGANAGAVGGNDLALSGVEPSGEEVQVRFTQVVAGVPIVGTVAFAVVGEHGVRYADYLLVPPPRVTWSLRTDHTQARRVARDYLARQAPAASIRADARLVVVYTSGGFHLAWRLEGDTLRPSGYWAVYVAAASGSVVAFEELGMGGVEGVVRFAIEPLCQGAGTEIVGMPHVQRVARRSTDDAGAL